MDDQILQCLDIYYRNLLFHQVIHEYLYYKYIYSTMY